MHQIGKIDAGKCDPEYAAALYILTVDYATWDKSNGFVKRTGIDMDAILHASIFSSGETILVLLAGNLFNEQQSANPIELLHLDESNFHLALDAIKIRRYGLRVSDFK